MSTKDYIEYSKKESYKEQLDYLSKFNLTSHNIKRFEDKIDAIIVSIDTEIRSSMSYVNELQRNVDETANKPEMKGLVDDPWYKVYKLQSNLIKYLIRAGSFKTWLIKFLIVSNNKLMEFLDSINENLVELKKVEMQADMYKQMYQNLEEIRKGQQQQQGFFANQEYEQQINALKSQITGQQEAMVNMTNQLQTFNKMIDELTNREQTIRAATQTNKGIELPKQNAEPKPLALNPDTGEIVYEDEDDVDDEDDEVFDEEDDEEQFESDDDDDMPESMIDMDTDGVESEDDDDYDDGSMLTEKKTLDNNEHTPKNPSDGIEFDNFEDEMTFFKSFSEEHDFKIDQDGEVALVMRTAEDIEQHLGVNRDDYPKVDDRVNFIGLLAFKHNDYAYTRQALQDFFDVTPATLIRYIKQSGVKDKILWDV